ncbi:glucoamylase family protein [Danxiaibacter flavus]|uniref:Glucoamylase family protein n=1 Tax=Danxiaibacter flavus TaxID=3049108 RepID=A0ABV3ZKH1_9BACT|nr:glucoamylase family protein [Chitinophagaceae bacterium DXS]
MKKNHLLLIAAITCVLHSCSKKDETPTPPAPVPSSFSCSDITINGSQSFNGKNYFDVGRQPSLRFKFGAPLERSSVADNIVLLGATANVINCSTSFEDDDSVVVLKPSSTLTALSQFKVSAYTSLTSKSGGKLNNAISLSFVSSIDSTDKFPRISDNELLDLIQQKTFKYFWDLGHPVSGLARERNSSGDLVTTGGSGFGIMALVAMVDRGFKTRAEGLQRMKTIVSFLQTADNFHGAFPHWLDGNTGKVIPFSANDNGADLVETSFLMQGLLTARQYFNQAVPDEVALRQDIDSLWRRVEWSWFQNGTNSLYWHWSPDKQWVMNMPVSGWNEALITYILAASSPTHPIQKAVYDQGWAKNGNIRNGSSYYGIPLPLGDAFGGPLFFSHYSFLGLNPTGLKDAYADNYFVQNKNHTLINYNYCKINARGFFGYSDACWGLTASDIPNGYTASSPSNDVGVIAPTAAISSLPYTPEESMRAIRFFYYKLGDKLWGDYGFKDAFSLKDLWFADSFLAIDQGPQIVMIENYRSKLLWNLFMSSPEVKTGLTKLGFSGF